MEGSVTMKTFPNAFIPPSCRTVLYCFTVPKDSSSHVQIVYFAVQEDNCHFLRVDKDDFNRILRDVEANTVRLKEHDVDVLLLEKLPAEASPVGSRWASPAGSRYAATRFSTKGHTVG